METYTTTINGRPVSIKGTTVVKNPFGTSVDTTTPLQSVNDIYSPEPRTVPIEGTTVSYKFTPPKGRTPLIYPEVKEGPFAPPLPTKPTPTGMAPLSTVTTNAPAPNIQSELNAIAKSFGETKAAEAVSRLPAYDIGAYDRPVSLSELISNVQTIKPSLKTREGIEARLAEVQQAIDETPSTAVDAKFALVKERSTLMTKLDTLSDTGSRFAGYSSAEIVPYGIAAGQVLTGKPVAIGGYVARTLPPTAQQITRGLNPIMTPLTKEETTTDQKTGVKTGETYELEKTREIQLQRTTPTFEFLKQKQFQKTIPETVTRKRQEEETTTMQRVMQVQKPVLAMAELTKVAEEQVQVQKPIQLPVQLPITKQLELTMTAGATATPQYQQITFAIPNITTTPIIPSTPEIPNTTITIFPPLFPNLMPMPFPPIGGGRSYGPGRGDKRTLYSDLLNVMRSEIAYGKATHPSLLRRPELWAGEMTGVKTVEQLTMAPKRVGVKAPKINIFGGTAGTGALGMLGGGAVKGGRINVGLAPVGRFPRIKVK